jgi:hypothetical protein
VARSDFSTAQPAAAIKNRLPSLRAEQALAPLRRDQDDLSRSQALSPAFETTKVGEVVFRVQFQHTQPGTHRVV